MLALCSLGVAGLVTEANGLSCGWARARCALPVLAGLGVKDRSRVAMVGDALETDVLGAKSAGLTSVRHHQL